MTPRRAIYLDGTDLERGCEALMRFRLTYDGPLKATQQTNAAGDPRLFTDKRAEHKHEIRQNFHRQLKELWTRNKFLNGCSVAPSTHTNVLPSAAESIDWGEAQYMQRPLHEVLADIYDKTGNRFRYVPLVWAENSLFCSLLILFLRRDWPAPVLTAGDIDNRVKTLVDALSIPRAGQNFSAIPGDGENPFFVLLDDDRQVTHLEVETDSALLPSPKDPNDLSYARIIITVDIRPYYVSMFNLSWA